MPSSFRVLILLALLALTTEPARAEGTLIAHYTFDQTLTDATGNHGDADARNTPFEDGGIFLNGNYYGTDPDSSLMRTPALESLDPAAFSVSVEFRVAELPVSQMPVLVVGHSWRWLGATVQNDGELKLLYNGSDGAATGVILSPGSWHVLGLLYDGDTAHLILDGVKVSSQAYTPNTGDDRVLTAHHSGRGTNFHGHLRNLRVFDGVVGALPVERVGFGALKGAYWR